MCFGCWSTAGMPDTINDATRRAALAAAAVDDLTDPAWAFRELVEDWELGDEALLRCDEALARCRAIGRDAPALEAYVECLEAFRSLNVDDRYAAMAIFEGFIPTVAQLGVVVEVVGR